MRPSSRSLPGGWKVAIDGPAASGKTTVARAVARALDYAVIDTGAMYRAVALEALRRRASLNDETLLSTLAREEAQHYRFAPDPEGSEGYRLIIRGEDVTASLHDPEVSAVVARVAAVPGVRRVLASEQRRLGLEGAVVMTGRDIGTVVLPEAEVKIYLTASAQERARRRGRDLEARGSRPAQAVVLESIRERDETDTSREDSPLAQASDAIIVDTTDMTFEQVVERILDLMEQKAASSAQ